MIPTRIVPDGRFWYGPRRYLVVSTDETGQVTWRGYRLKDARALASVMASASVPLGPLAAAIAEICEEQGYPVDRRP